MPWMRLQYVLKNGKGHTMDAWVPLTETERTMQFLEQMLRQHGTRYCECGKFKWETLRGDGYIILRCRHCMIYIEIKIIKASG